MAAFHGRRGRRRGDPRRRSRLWGRPRTDRAHVHESGRADADITVRRTAGVAVVTMSGELDVARVTTVRDQLLDVPRSLPTGIVVDLSGVAFCDLASLRVLAQLGRRAEEDGTWLRLAAPSPVVRRLLEISGLAATLPCFDDVEAALRGQNLGASSPFPLP